MFAASNARALSATTIACQYFTVNLILKKVVPRNKTITKARGRAGGTLYIGGSAEKTLNYQKIIFKYIISVILI
jgi:hypothetical protein